MNTLVIICVWFVISPFCIFVFLEETRPSWSKNDIYILSLRDLTTWLKCRIYYQNSLCQCQFAVEITTNYFLLSGTIFSAGTSKCWNDICTDLSGEGSRERQINERQEMLLIFRLWTLLLSKKSSLRLFIIFIIACKK